MKPEDKKTTIVEDAEKETGQEAPPREEQTASASEHPAGAQPDAPGAATSAGAGPAAEGPSSESEPQAATPGTSELEEARRQAEENFDKFVRLQAEFENFKKRMQKEQSDTLKYAQLPLMRDLIVILDNLERAIDHARNGQDQDSEALLSGIELVVKQIMDTFGRFGMTRIESRGQAFDPTCHEAMGLVETNEVPENQVMEEHQAGYRLHDRIVRPAMVTVSKRGG